MELCLINWRINLLLLWLLGGTGKSATTVRFVMGLFIELYDPTIEDSYTKEHNGHRFEILDTAGSDALTAIREFYLRSGDAFLFVFPILKDEYSIAYLDRNLAKIISIKSDIQDIPIIVSLNKRDLINENTPKELIQQEDEILTVLQKHNCVNYSIIETSAKTGHNINRLFEECVERKMFSILSNMKLLEQAIEKDKNLLKGEQKKCKIM